MSTKLLLEYAMFANLLIGSGILILMVQKGLLLDFKVLAAFLAVNAIEDGVSIALMFFRKDFGISKVFCYDIYFYSHWVFFFVEYALILFVIYSVYSKAMQPLEGLHRAGRIVFRWIGLVCVALSVVLSMGPHTKGLYFIATFAGQVQQGISVLILCLLLFVCFATRYLGLTYRSHIFGISLGLGIFATASLIESAWYANGVGQTVYSPIYLFAALGSCVALLTWGTYFAMPEPERKMILLPTTSPFFLWNTISGALGDEPGFVAIAGFKPDMLAPAELTVLTAASRWAKERDEARVREAEHEVAARETEAAMAKQHTMAFHSIAMPR